MNSNEFLTEEYMINKNYNDYNINRGLDTGMAELIKLIQRDCKPFLKQSKGRYIYRGLSNADKKLIKKKTRLGNRNPTDMPIEIHDKLNKFFKMKFGEPFRNAMFTTGSSIEASQYGTVYQIFPIGDFTFLWSPKVEDLFQEWEEYAPDNWHKTRYKKALKEFHDELLTTYTDKNLIKAIGSDHEIMVRCKSYYAVNNDIVFNPWSKV